MGEKVTIGGLSDAATRSIAKAVELGLKPLVAAVAASTGNPVPAPLLDAGGPLDNAEPWTRTSTGTGPDRHVTVGRAVAAFIDNGGNPRWVAADKIGDVPAGWRPVLLGPPVLPKSERVA